MAGTNQFYPFATGAGANVLTTTSYLALNARQTGFQAGIAQSIQMNTTWRQSSVVASMIGSFIVDQGLDALDDGDLAKLLANFEAALRKVVLTTLPASAYWHVGLDSSTTPGTIIADVTPDISGYGTGHVYALRMNRASVGGGTRANLDALGLRDVLRHDGSPVQTGDWAQNEFVVVVDNGAALRMAVPSIAEIQGLTSPLSQVHVGTAVVPSGGSNAALVVTDLVPPITAYTDRMLFEIFFAGGVADNGTINVRAADGVTMLGAIPLQRGDATPIRVADARPGINLLLNTFSTTAMRILGLGRGEVPIIPTTSPVLWVRPGGNDANDGSANNDANAFATIAAARDYGLSRFSLAGGTVTIRLGVGGVYAAPGVIPPTVGTLAILGDESNKESFVLEGATTGAAGPIFAQGSVFVSGVSLRNNNAAASTAVSSLGGTLNLRNVLLTSTVTGVSHIGAGNGARIAILDGVSVSNGMNFLFSAVTGGSIQINGSFELRGTPNFAGAVAYAASLGQIGVAANVNPGGTGATGKRFLVDNNGVISTGGRGDNLFPGDQAGIRSNGGVYN